jgi:nucleotide-binding universal stress UspA family protein
MKILIGYDGSDYANAAIEELVRAGLPETADARVVSIADVWPHLPDECFEEPSDPAALQQMSPIVRRAHELAREAMRDARAMAETASQRLRQLFPRWNPSFAALPGSAATAIVKEAQACEADLIVVGSHGRGAIGRALLGSVSQGVLTHAPCSVRVARLRAGQPPPPPNDKPVRLVLGLDGSPHSAAALNAVTLRSWPAGTEVCVVIAKDVRLATVVPTLAPDLGWSFPTGVPGEDAQDWPAHAAQAAVTELHRAGVGAVPMVREGDPKRVLIEEAETFAADCIFVGARGMSRVEGFLLGSVSAAVAARASCSVEVVRFE